MPASWTPPLKADFRLVRISQSDHHNPIVHAANAEIQSTKTIFILKFYRPKERIIFITGLIM
jgi:hypothetical protein